MNATQHYIAAQPRTQQEIMSVLRRMILDMGPHVQEQIKNHVPYFSFRGPICYMSPKYDGVDLCFTHGRDLSDEDHLLESNNRKYVRSMHFHSLAELEEHEHQVRQLLNEAAIVNQYKQYQKGVMA